MNAVLKLLRNFAEQLFKASVTISSYWSSAVLFITLMCGSLPLKILKISHLTYFVLLNFINWLVCFQRISYKFNEVLNYWFKLIIPDEVVEMGSYAFATASLNRSSSLSETVRRAVAHDADAGPHPQTARLADLFGLRAHDLHQAHWATSHARRIVCTRQCAVSPGRWTACRPRRTRPWRRAPEQKLISRTIRMGSTFQWYS